jgi:uncharacterized protein YgiM (DUF1202 family)
MYGIGPSSPRRRGFGVIIGVMVLVLVVGGVFYGFYALVLDNDDATATPDLPGTATAPAIVAATNTAFAPTRTVAPLPATATASLTPSPTDTPLPTPTLRPPPEVITTGVHARVNISTGLALNVRDQPSLSGSTVITRLLAGAEVNVVGGPEDAGDLRWWNVEDDESENGWVVEAYGDETWLIPVGWSDQMAPLAGAVAEVTPSPEATALSLTQTLTATTGAPEEATPVATPVLTATATPVVTSTGEVSAPAVGGRVQVTTRYQYVNLRAAPGLDAEIVGQLENGAIASVVEGPEEANDLRWWKVQDDAGNAGWAAESVGGETLLVPVP